MDGVTLPAGSSLSIFTAEERPDRWQRAAPLFSGIWPEYDLHGNRSGEYFGQLVPRYAWFQLLLYDGAVDRIVGRGRACAARGGRRRRAVLGT